MWLCSYTKKKEKEVWATTTQCLMAKCFHFGVALVFELSHLFMSTHTQSQFMPVIKSV